MPSVTAVDTRFGYLHCSCQPYMLFMLDITIHSDQDIKYIINKTLQKIGRWQTLTYMYIQYVHNNYIYNYSIYSRSILLYNT